MGVVVKNPDLRLSGGPRLFRGVGALSSLGRKLSKLKRLHPSKPLLDFHFVPINQCAVCLNCSEVSATVNSREDVMGDEEV